MFLTWLLACAPPPIDTAPSITITWPPAETEIVGCETVTVEVKNFKLVDFANATPTEGEGHYHLYNPNGYSACFKPYCFVDLSDLAATTAPYFTAVLAASDHTELTGDDGKPIEFTVPIVFTPGPCAATGGGDDTGGDDTGA